jgi:hypothetical protein
MRTKPARSDAERIRAFREKLSQASIVEIDDATIYWLEDQDRRQIGAASSTSEAPLLAALAEIQRGLNPNDLSLLCDVPDKGAPDDRRYVITSGDFLVEFAESAAGIPARPRMPAPGELPGYDGKRPFSRHLASGSAPAQDAVAGSGFPRPKPPKT